MENFGDELRRAREARGIPLRVMATRTKIPVGNLEALERNEFRKLPGGIFGRSFVRTYALEVGLDPDAIVSRFGDELAEAERAADERRRSRQPEITVDDRQFLDRQRRAYLWLRIGLVVGVVLAIGLATWTIRQVWSAVPAAAGEGALDPSAAPVAVPPAVETVGAEPPAAVDAASGAAGPGAPTAVAPAGVSAAIVAQFEFSGDSWSTIGVDGKSELPHLYKAGDRARFEATRELLVDLGNAGVARLTINGRVARPLGASGSHVRVRITPENVNGFF